MRSRIKVLSGQSVVLLSVILVMVSLCYAQGYPARAIDIVIPYGAGGGTDNFFRLIQPALSKELNVAVNIVNRTGGGGVVGTSFVANAKPDGYTLIGTTDSAFLLPEIVKPKTIPYHVLEDFVPIAGLGWEPLIVVIRPVPEFESIKTFRDLVAYEKKNPGKLLTACAGVGSPCDIDLKILKTTHGYDPREMIMISGGEIITQILGGHLDWIIATVPVPKPHIQIGKLRALAVVSPVRIPDFPQVPTMIEEGFPEVNVGMDFAALGPKGL